MADYLLAILVFAGFSILGVLFTSVLLWVASKLLKFLDSGFGTALKTVLAYFVVSLVISVATIVPSFLGLSVVSTILGLLALPVYFLVFAGLVRSFYSIDWGKAFLAVLIVFGIEAILLALLIVPVVLWQLGIFSPTTSTVTTGWTRLQPLGPTVTYKSSGQSFTASFNNAAGNRINVTGIDVKERLSGSMGTPCSAFIDGKPSSSLDNNAATVSAGNAFTIRAECPDADRKRGDPYDMSITINYESVLGGIKTTHAETGIVRGSAE